MEKFKLPKGISNERAIEILVYELNEVWERLNQVVNYINNEKFKKCDCGSDYTGLPHKSTCGSYK